MSDDAMHIGYDHTLRPVHDQNERLVGWIHTHPDARNPSVLCQSFCAVRPVDGAPVHSILQAEPLTLSPSLKCRTCGSHGEVVNGLWKPSL